MKFTIIMQSYLGSYKNSATDRKNKLLRAVNSVISQTYQDYELIIISDNCKKTVELITGNFQLNDKIRLILHPGLKKQYGMWYSYCRNVGIDKANGDYILYLDTDDYYEIDYLERLNNLIGDKCLYFVDDITLYRNEKQQRKVNLMRYKCGTSNVVHSRCMARWRDITRYANDDYEFIESLIAEFVDYEVLTIAGYVVGHIPGKYDK